MSKKQEPGLGAVSVPLAFEVQIGSAWYRFSSPGITFTPQGSETVRALSGVGSFLPMPLPTPVPTPTPVPNPTPTPTPSPGPLRNVRNDGAKGDGTTDDRAAIQRAIDGCPGGGTVYFPAGRYRITDMIRLYTQSGITFLGEGPSSLLLHPQSQGLTLGNGSALTGLSVRALAFQGSGDGIALFGPQGTVIAGCTFTGCGKAVDCEGPGAGHGATKGTQILACDIQGWGSVGLFLNGGEIIRNCILNQTAPRGTGSHGIYIHSGASDVLVEDTTIQNAGKYAAQTYGEEVGTVTRNTTFRRVTIKDCQGGIILAHSQMGAADIEGCLIEDCDISGVWGGPGVHYKNGKEVTIRGNRISGIQGPGITVGYLAPYEPNFSLGPALIENNTVHDCLQGFWAMQSHGATFEAIRVSNNDFSGNQSFDIHLEEWNGVKPKLTLAGNLGRVTGTVGD